MPKLMLDAAVRNHKGNVRKNNEDNFYLSGAYMDLSAMDKGGLFTARRTGGVQMYAVCDGMGGTERGELASYQGAQLLSFFHEGLSASVEDEQLLSVVQRISRAIFDRAQNDGVACGTTLAMCVWQRGEMRVLHVGDSRVYRARDGELEQVTVDHSEVQQMIEVGMITPEEARTHAKRHVITQYLGMPAKEIALSPSLSAPQRCRAGDWYLLCSDGLTDMVRDDRIAEVLNSSPDSSTACERLVEQALRAGGVDNVTVMCLRVVKGRWLDGLRVSKRALLGLGAGICGLTALASLAELLLRLFR